MVFETDSYRIKSLLMNCLVKLSFVLGTLFFVGCGTSREIPVNYDAQTVSKAANNVRISAGKVNHSTVYVAFDGLPDGVLVSPGDISVNGEKVSAVWEYYHGDAYMIRKSDRRTEPFNTFSEEQPLGKRWPYILRVRFERPKNAETVRIDFSDYMKLDGKPVLPDPVQLSLK